MISNPEYYKKLVTEELNRFTLNVRTLSSQNLRDNNIIAEDIFRDLLNIIYDWKLRNVNFDTINAAAIDLADDNNKIAIQVTSTEEKWKIKDTITVFEKKKYNEKYEKLKFFIIGEKEDISKKKAFKTDVTKKYFNPDEYIIDTEGLIRIIHNLDFDKLKEVALFIRRLFAGEGFKDELPFHKWYPNLLQQTNKYVDVDQWDEVAKVINQFIDFENDTPYPVLTILGFPGVGKTRFVAETIKKNDYYKNYAIYQENTIDAQNLIKAIVRSEEKIIVIVDECSKASWAEIKELTYGHKERIRVITIDNMIEEWSSEEYPAIMKLSEMNFETVIKILDVNFANTVLSIEHRHQYAQYAGGFVSFAAFLCEAHTEIVKLGSFNPIQLNIRAYVEKKLQNEVHFDILLLLSLLTDVGYYGEYESELIGLIKHVKNFGKIYVVEDVIKAAIRLKDKFGFIRIRGKRFYVTPHILATIAYGLFCDKWIKDDFLEFFQTLPNNLKGKFQQRVNLSGRKEDYELVSESFRKLIIDFEPTDFKNSTKTFQLIKMVELNPDEYLPTLHRIIGETSDEILSSLKGFNIMGSGPRRELLWLLERLKRFPEYFRYSLDIILKLAVTENENNVANSATNVWVESFRLFHSHTPIPYIDRLEYLKDVMVSNDNKIINLAFEALRNINPMLTIEIVKTVVVSGKVAPEEWIPTGKEKLESYEAFFNSLEKLVESKKEILVNNAWDVYISEIKHLIPDAPIELIPRLREFISKHSDTMSEGLRVKIVARLEDFIDWYDEHGNIAKSYLDEVRDIVKQIKPDDLHNRLIMMLNTSNYRFVRNDEKQNEWSLQVKGIANELFTVENDLIKEIPCIHSKEAVNSVSLGVEIGLLDEKTVLWEDVINWALEYEFTGFARGYFSSIIYHHKLLTRELNQKFDEIQDEHPDIAFALYMIGGNQTNALERTINLVKQDKLQPHIFDNFTFGINKEPLSIKQYHDVLKLLVNSIDSDDTNIRSIILRFIEFRLSDESDNKDIEPIFKNKSVIKLIWKFLESVGQIKTHFAGDEHLWGSILIRMLKFDFDKSISLLAEGLISEDYVQRDEAEERLVEIIDQAKKENKTKDIEKTVRIIGNLMLQDKKGVLFYFNNNKKLFENFPVPAIKNWLDDVGIKGAIKIARHLPEPRIDKNGNPFVPKQTMFVLDNYGDNKRVFEEFCIAYNNPKSRSGDIAGKILIEIEEVKKFRNHEKEIIRKWAEQEIRSKKGEYEHWKKIQDEDVY